MTKIKQITNYLESIAPIHYQEGYDNSGLITGSPDQKVTGVLITLDATEPIIDEAIEKGCNLVVAHHPIVFGGLKKLNGKNYVERTVIKAIKNDVAIYAIHTNLDNMYNGVNAMISHKLELQNIKILAPKKNTLRKLTTFVPHENKETLLNALSDAGAGHIGNYKNCSFQIDGTGTYQPNEKANPHIGTAGKLETVEEARIEVIFPMHLEGRILSALKTAHPYEEVAYYLHSLENKNQEIGAGMIGTLKIPLEPKEFLNYLKSNMDLKCIRHTKLLNKKIKKVALCGGSGSFLLSRAMGAGADVYITGDFKYHEFFDAEDKIVIADIGHYESEVFTKNLLHDFLIGEFSILPLKLSEVNTNPVNYYF